MGEEWEPEGRYHKDPNLTLPAFPDFESPKIRGKGLVEVAKPGGDFQQWLNGVMAKPPPKSLLNSDLPPFFKALIEQSDLQSAPKTEFPPPMLVERLKPTPLPQGALYPGNPAVLRPTPTPRSKAAPASAKLFPHLVPEVIRTDQAPPLLSTRPLPNQPPNVMQECQICQQVSLLSFCPNCQAQVCQQCKQTTMGQKCPLCMR